MKNSSHPLLQALSRKGKPDEPTAHTFESDRLFQIKKEDIPPQTKMDAGDNARFVIHGRVRSTHDDGTMMMHVEKVEHQPSKGDVADAPKDILTTQESHTP